MHEAQLHENNCSLTLTYDEQNYSPSLDRRDFQLFMKKARFHFAPTRMSYLMCGEYGEKELRPHFHVALFGVNFDKDKYYWCKSPSGCDLYRSPTLEKLWTMGGSTIGDVTFESVGYIARYVTKKVTGEKADKHYERVDAETGELIKVKPEFIGMSLNPAIGKRWIEKYGNTDVFPHDRIVANGYEAKPPRYYDKILEQVNPEQYERMKEKRKNDSKRNEQDNTKERLKAKEAVARAALKIKKRTI